MINGRQFFLFLFFAEIMNVSISFVSLASQITINIDPDSEQPKEVAIIRMGGAPVLLGRTTAANASVYVGEATTASPTEWATNYTLVARWQDISQQLYLRITRDAPNSIQLRIINRRHPVNYTTLDMLERLGQDFFSLLERYFGSRDVYRKISNPNHPVKCRAFRIWYDTAFLLHTSFSYIGLDEEVIQLAGDLQRETTTGESCRKYIPKKVFLDIVRPKYFAAMNEQFIAAEWKDVGLV